MPIKQARAVFEDAVRSFTLDSIVNYQDEQIRLLKEQNEVVNGKFSQLLALESEKFAKQKEITGDFARLANSWRDQSDYYQKRYKKQRRQKGLLTAGMVGLLILIIVK